MTKLHWTYLQYTSCEKFVKVFIWLALVLKLFENEKGESVAILMSVQRTSIECSAHKYCLVWTNIVALIGPVCQHDPELPDFRETTVRNF
jgi:hypothetical protein